MLFCKIHIDIVLKVKYQRCTLLGKREKPCNVIFLPTVNQSNPAPPHVKTTPESSSSTLTCYRDLKCSNSLGRNSAASLSSIYLIMWSWLSSSASQKNPLWTAKKKTSCVWSKKEENCRNLFSPYGFELFYPEGWVDFGWVKNRAFSRNATSVERWTEAERRELVRFQQH